MNIKKNIINFFLFYFSLTLQEKFTKVHDLQIFNFIGLQKSTRKLNYESGFVIIGNESILISF